MHATLGNRLALALASTGHRFGELTVASALHVGDGGTFHCHVQREALPGTWGLHRVETEPLGAIVASREGSSPVAWDDAGAIIIDTAVGAFIPLAAAEDLEAQDDLEDFALDAIDEALFGSDADEAVLPSPGGHPLAVFRMIGDGTYAVLEGRDADGAVCTLAVIQWDEPERAEPSPADA